MSKEILRRATDLVRQGMLDEAINLVRPVVKDDEDKVKALSILAYCYHKQKNENAARYLYGELIRLDPANDKWPQNLKKLRDAAEQKVSEIKADEISNKPVVRGLALLVLAGLLTLVALPGLLNDIIHDTLGLSEFVIMAALLPVSGVAALGGLFLLARRCVASLRRAERIRVVLGGEFAQGRLRECRSCHLGYPKRLKNCMYCGAPRKEPKAEGPAAAAEAGGAAIAPGQTPSPVLFSPGPVAGTPRTHPVIGYFTTREPEITESPALPSTIGGMLLVGFFLPVVVGSEVSFVNFEMVKTDLLPVPLRIEFLYPLLAGIATLLLAFRPRSFGRGTVFLILAALPILMGLGGASKNTDVLEMLGDNPLGGMAAFPLAEAKGAVVVVILMVLSWIGLLAGARAVQLKPLSAMPAIVGAVAGGMYCLTLLLPVLPNEVGAVFLVAPFKLFGLKTEEGVSPVLMSLLLLGHMGLLLWASVSALSFLKRDSENPQRGLLTWTLWVGGMACLFVMALYLFSALARATGGGGKLFFSLLFGTLKAVAWLFGLFLLLPLGLSELLAEISAERRLATLFPVIGGKTNVQRMDELKRMLDQGLITPHDYEIKKREIISDL